MNALEVEIAKIKLKSPIIAASGIVGYGQELSKFTPLSSFGGVAIKGTTLKSKMGNLSPRVVETEGGMLNSVGLENPGIDYFIKNKLPWLLKQNTKIIANIAGATILEYEALAEKLNSTDVDFIELNISCPNVKQGGASFGANPKTAFEVVAKARKKTTKPLIAKLTPNTKSVVDVAKSVELAGADAICLINTISAMRINIETKRPALKNNFGGLSGPAIFPIALKLVYETAKSVNLPIIGCGGICCFENIIEMIMAGACAVEIGTVLFSNYNAAAEFNANLQNWLNVHNVKSIAQLTGSVELW